MYEGDFAEWDLKIGVTETLQVFKRNIAKTLLCTTLSRTGHGQFQDVQKVLKLFCRS